MAMSKDCISLIISSMPPILESFGYVDIVEVLFLTRLTRGGADFEIIWIKRDTKLSSLIEIFSSVAVILTSIKRDYGFCDFFSEHISFDMCQKIMDTLEGSRSDEMDRLVQAVFTVASHLKYSVATYLKIVTIAYF